MVPTEKTLKYFGEIPYRARAAFARSSAPVAFEYDNEPFFVSYEALRRVWTKRESRRKAAELCNVGRQTITEWEKAFVDYGALGLLADISFVQIDSRLERLAVLVKEARPHERANCVLRLAEALGIPAGLDSIRAAQRSHGYGQRMGDDDVEYFKGLQHIFESVSKQKEKVRPMHDAGNRTKTFFNFEKDHLQQRMELMRTLSQCEGKRRIRPVLRQFGVASNRFYVLRDRYMAYGVWGLVDLVQKGLKGEKISPELELQIIEERLMSPSLSTAKAIEKLKLKCSKSNVQKVYSRWGLSKIRKAVAVRGVQACGPNTEAASEIRRRIEPSAKARFPNLIENARLKVNGSFSMLVKRLAYRSYSISNPGAIIAAPFLNQLGVVEALHTYGPETFKPVEITNDIVVNTLRIIVGFPDIHDYTLNSDRSVAIGAGLSLNPKKSRFYDSFDKLRFDHLQRLRNDASRRARELGIVEGREIAVDYHCDPSDSRYPADKSLSKSPDKKGDLVYAHRPQIIWDSATNTIVNIAYCEGRSRAPSALYKFCEENLFKIIDPDAVEEIYADSEYTGEKQIVYLTVRSKADVTMCLKQNPRIKKWKEETVGEVKWEDYGKQYRIAGKDYVLAETGKPFRFIVKQNKETGETRCFGSTHTDRAAVKILDSYHVRWPVETGIKDLTENYFLNKPTGTSPEKVEAHYYCVMLAKLTTDYFRSVLCMPHWRTPEEWDCVLSTIRTCIFSNQNCELSLHESGDLLVTYLDGDSHGIKRRLKDTLDKRRENGLNLVPWWGNRGVRVSIKDQYDN